MWITAPFVNDHCDFSAHFVFSDVGDVSFAQQVATDVKTIKNALESAHEVGLVMRWIPGCTGTAHSLDNVEEVVCHFTERSRLSTRRAGLELDMSYQSIIRILVARISAVRPHACPARDTVTVQLCRSISSEKSRLSRFQ